MPAGSNVDTGDVLRLTGLTAGAYGEELVPAMDVSGYKWLSLAIGPDPYDGVLTFQGSFDNTNWDNITLYLLSSLLGGDSASSTQGFGIIVGGPIRFPYFKVWMSSYTSGGATGVLELRKDGLPGFSLISGYSKLLDGAAHVGFTNNDGTSNTAIAAGEASDTVIWAGPSVLSRILVTATGTNQLEVYDNSSAGSGDLIAIIPASTAVTGVPFVYKWPCSSGITVKGNSNNPGVSISYAGISGL